MSCITQPVSSKRREANARFRQAVKGGDLCWSSKLKKVNLVCQLANSPYLRNENNEHCKTSHVAKTLSLGPFFPSILSSTRPYHCIMDIYMEKHYTAIWTHREALWDTYSNPMRAPALDLALLSLHLPSEGQYMTRISIFPGHIKLVISSLDISLSRHLHKMCNH